MLVAVSMSAAEIMVSEVIAKFTEVGLTLGAQKTHWTSYPKMMDKSIMVDGLAVVWEEVLEFVGSKVCLDGNARRAIAHRSAQANKCMTKWRPVLSSLWLPRLLRLNIVKTTMWQAFLWCSSVWTTVKTQRDKIASWSERMVANVIGVKRPPWMELDQWWRLWHRIGHRWIEKGNMNVWTAIRERMLSWAGHVARMDHKEICAKALRCRGLQWWRWRQQHWKEVEEDKLSGPHNVSKSTGGRTWSRRRFPATWSARERNERWYRAGYGWLDSYGSGYGRRRGCGGIPEDVLFCVSCRMVPCRCGVEVLSWNVSGNVFLWQTSLFKTGILKLGMTDFFHVGELIPRPKTMERALHTMVTNTCMNPNTEQEFCTALVSQLCQVLRGYNCVNVGLKLLESVQMDCRGAAVIQATLWARMSVIVSMAPVVSMAPMASMVASMDPMASMVASMDSVASMASMVVASLASMASMGWVDLMAPEL